MQWLRTINNDNYPLFSKKRREENPTTEGLEDILSEADRRLALLSGDDRLIFAGNLNTILGFATDQFDVKQEMVTRIENYPESLAAFPFDPVVETYVLHILKEKGDPEGFIKQYLASGTTPNNQALAIYFLVSIYTYTTYKDMSKAKFWLTRLVEDYPGTRQAHDAASQLRQMSLIGSQAPAFTLNDITGKQVSLSDFAGKFVLLDFWATWCGPCILAFPKLLEAYKQLDHDKIEFVSICLDLKKEKLTAFSKKHALIWPQLWDETHFHAPSAKAYSVNYLPNIFLIGPNGRIIRQNEGLQGDMLLPTLRQYLESGD
jgi:peroxiredoxin